jgi:hypothetical protein
MKKKAAVILTVIFGTTLAFAHQMEGGSTEGLFGLKAEYLHVLLNPLPVYGLAMGALVLAVALVARSKAARNIGLVVIVLCAASAWPVLIYGQHGYNHLYPQLDPESQQWLEVHMDRAERFIYAFYFTALIGVAALLLQKKFPRAAKILTLVTLAAAIAALGIGGWISRAGGEVSHSEFRGEEMPPSVPDHQHPGGSDHKMEMSQTNEGHPHGDAVSQSAGKAPMPNTLEGIWTELHKQRTELESVVKDKKFGEIHPHAVAIQELAKRLVDIVHPDHKTAVKDGVDKVNRAVGELHKAAHTEDQTAAEMNFKQFDEALKQLEEQMKKQ